MLDGVQRFRFFTIQSFLLPLIPSNTPHPTSLRSATFSRKGGRQVSQALPHPWKISLPMSASRHPVRPRSNGSQDLAREGTRT
ncbi:protein of unknown function [Aminobacter niigataensis]|nr:protein of unknown function [Aminobacter niigataensis]